MRTNSKILFGIELCPGDLRRHDCCCVGMGVNDLMTIQLETVVGQKNRIHSQTGAFWCQKEISELVREVKSLPRTVATPLMSKIGALVSQAKIQQRKSEFFADILSEFELKIKCLTFDLEIKRNERDDYHKRLRE